MNQYKAIDLGLETLGLKQDKILSRNLSPKELVSDIIKNGEGLIASSGAAMIDSGEYTGRSPNCLLYTSPSPRDHQPSRMPSSA